MSTWIGAGWGGSSSALVLVALAVTSAALFAVGAQRTARSTSCHSQGVPVEAKVTGCLGLLGGSGSNAAGYDCQVTYVVAGHRYNEPVPGQSLRHPGSTVRVVVAAGDPALLPRPTAGQREHASWHVFILPVVLLALLAGGIAVVVVRRRSAHRA